MFRKQGYKILIAVVLAVAVFTAVSARKSQAVGLVFGGRVLAFIITTPPIVISVVPPIVIPPCPPHVLIFDLAKKTTIGVTVTGKWYENYTFEVPGVNTLGQHLPTPIFCSSIGYLVFPLVQEGSSLH